MSIQANIVHSTITSILSFKCFIYFTSPSLSAPTTPALTPFPSGVSLP
ncbi:MAG TPA: hypothetical protein VGB37_00895 [Candidatus Lokiarchaeia archaeon]